MASLSGEYGLLVHVAGATCSSPPALRVGAEDRLAGEPLRASSSGVQGTRETPDPKRSRQQWRQLRGSHLSPASARASVPSPPALGMTEHDHRRDSQTHYAADCGTNGNLMLVVSSAMPASRLPRGVGPERKPSPTSGMVGN